MGPSADAAPHPPSPGRVTASRFRTLFAAAAALTVGVLAVFAYLLVHAQSEARHDVERRFRDRAAISAALTESLFSVSLSSTRMQASERFGGTTVSKARLDQQVAQGGSSYGRILDARGRVLAASTGAPAPPGALPVHVRQALRGQATLSDVLPGAGGVVEWAIPFQTRHGLRVQVTGIHLALLQNFLGGFLGRLPNSSRLVSAVVDRDATVVGSPSPSEKAGRRLANAKLVSALHDERSGSYGDRYFASAPIAGSPWRVVVDVSKDRLYSSVNGSRRNVPWVVFGLLAAAAIAGLFLLRRVAKTRGELARREINQRHAIQINDNVLQRLAVAKYAMEKGDESFTHDKLVETMREAQRLINQLLAEGDVEPGQLRRGESASLEPEPSEPSAPVER
jgi:hypothetical protein